MRLASACRRLSAVLAATLAVVPMFTSPDSVRADDALNARCLEILRTGLKSDEFWPSMHAAEALTQAGQGAEVRACLIPKLKTETDLQKRCGIARELVRAGDRTGVSVLLDVLADKNPHGHVHACESLFKINEIGDGRLLRAAAATTDTPSKTTMAAAALARWGSPAALAVLRKQVREADGKVSMIGAWALARLGDESDLPALRDGVRRYEDPQTRAFFEHALAALGDADGRATLVKNLSSNDPVVKTYACEFAPEVALGDDGKKALLALLDEKTLDLRIRASQALILLSQPRVDRAVQREEIVRDVYPATAANPRYSEGTVFDQRDGSLMFVTTEFFKEESDFAQARLIARDSRDGGRTWGEPRVVQENTGKLNVMSASLIRPAGRIGGDEPLGLFYCETNSFSEIKLWLRSSRDDGRTFGAATEVSVVPGYHCLNNDRIIRLSSGRLLCPIASTEDVIKVNHFKSSCFLSDDAGKTWRKGKGDVDYGMRGAMEPEVLELNDGRVLMHFRTQLGHIAACTSSDGGETWTKAESWNVRAPEAPSTLRRIPSTGDLVLIWNDSYTAGAAHSGKRTPLTIAISSDEGKTWSHKRNLDARPAETYAYTSLLFHQGRAVMSYYVGDDKTARIGSRFRSLPIGSLYEGK